MRWTNFSARPSFAMEKQNQIKRTLEETGSIETIRRLLADGEHASRSSLAEAACQHFGFLDPRMRTQTAGCVKALRELVTSNVDSTTAYGRCVR